MLLASNAIIALQPLIYGAFVDALQTDGVHALKFAWIYGGVHFGTFILYYLFHGPGRLMELKLSFQVSRHFMETQYEHLLHLPVEWHKNNHSGSVINRLKKAYNGLKDFTRNGFQYIKTIVQITIPAAAMIYYSTWFALFAFVVGVLVVVVIHKFDKSYIRSLVNLNEQEHGVVASILDSISNIITVVSLRLQKHMRKQLHERHNHMFASYKENITINEWKWFCANLLIKIIYCVIVVGYVYEHGKDIGPFQVGGLVALIGFINQFNNAFFDIALQYNQIVQFHTDVQCVDTIDQKTTSQTSLTIQLPAKWDRIEIQNLSFRYPKSNDVPINAGSKSSFGNYILKNLRMPLDSGKKIALIGASGCGKSTLLELLNGFYPPEPGALLNINHGSLPFETIHDHITLFPQKPEIFENTLYYNLTMGADYEDEEIRNACEIAGLDEIIELLPNGIHSKINESGVNLSGGQRQRLALARGILAAKTSQILVLDEPTSNIDTRHEKRIFKKLFEKFKARTIVVSIHGLHLLPLFDHVFILKNGEITVSENNIQLKEADLQNYY